MVCRFAPTKTLPLEKGRFAWGYLHHRNYANDFTLSSVIDEVAFEFGIRKDDFGTGFCKNIGEMEPLSQDTRSGIKARTNGVFLTTGLICVTWISIPCEWFC
jgi:hypothetical protein